MLCKLIGNALILIINTSINVYLFTNIPSELSIPRFQGFRNIPAVKMVAHFIQDSTLASALVLFRRRGRHIKIFSHTPTTLFHSSQAAQ